MLDKKMLYLSGLPRSGSTLLCQLLGMHSQLDSNGHSSPLCDALQKMRHHLSDNQFLLSQLDVNFEVGYQRLLNAFNGFINGWYSDTDKPWVVDKNRAWLMQLDLVKMLEPQFKMLVCIREPGQIYGSIEAQHQKTLLLDFPDHLANLSRHARADKLFASEGVIGAPIKAVESLQDVPEAIQQQIYYVIFEQLMEEPQEVMKGIYQWIGVENEAFDPKKLPVKPHESDSYYRFKYSHKTHPFIKPKQHHIISTRIEADIKQNFSGLYQLFYPNNAIK